MARSIIAVVVGFVLWSALWVGVNSTLFAQTSQAAARGEPVLHIRTLLGMLALSVICSLVSGAAAGRISGRTHPVMILAGLLLLVGIGVEASAWNLLPVWYHVLFLGLLIPVTVIAGRLERFGAAPRPA